MRQTARYCLALALIAGCGGAKTKDAVVSSSPGSKTTSESGDSAARMGKSLVRLVNAMPGQPLDLTTEDRATFVNVAFMQVTPYTEVRNNMIKFRVRANDGDSVLAENNEAISDGSRYTVIAMPTPDGNVAIHVMKDELVPDSGKARIRLIQATPGLSDVDVAMTGQKDLIFDNVKYRAEVGYKDVSPGTVTLEFRMGEPPHVTVPLRLKTMNLEAGRAYTLVILGAQPHGIQALVFNDKVRR